MDDNSLSPVPCLFLINRTVRPDHPKQGRDPVYRNELNEVTLRWKKATRALRQPEQQYGKYLTDILERRADPELVYFKDPVEAAAFFCLVDLAKRLNCGTCDVDAKEDPNAITLDHRFPLY